MIKKFFLFVFFLSCNNLIAQTSLFVENSFNTKVQVSIDSIFNFNFTNVDEIKKELEERYPEHPFGDLYYSIMLYWKYFPITPQSEYHNSYVDALNNAIDKLDLALEDDPENSELSFFNLMSQLLILQYYADNNMSSKVIPYVAPAYRLVKKGFVLKDSINDFYFSTGIYNYYREYYPKAHPMYKAVAVFFPKGDAKEGLKQLEWTFENGIYLKSNALFFLVYINLYFEKDYKHALKYARQLENQFPNNLLYVSYKIRILLIFEKYSRASTQISQLRNISHQNDFFIIIADLFDAIILEKKEKNYWKAESIYWDVIKKMNNYGDFGNFYKAIAYFGLSRIYLEMDKAKSKDYRKLAEELTAYSHINFD